MGKFKEYLSRILPPAAVLAVVWYVTLPVLRYTMMMQEQKGLFLLAPDYFRQLFSDPHPVTNLISSFLVQFYRVAGLGALITALIVMKVYLMTCTIFRFTSWRPLAGALAAAASWYAIASAPTPQRGVAILLYLFLAALVSFAIPYRKLFRGMGKPVSLWQSAAVAVVMVGSATLIVKDSGIRENERWNAIEYLSRSHDWDVLLQIVTPGECRKDMSYTPYALLALNAKGQLGERIADYPVTGPESLGDLGEMNWSGYSLRSQIYEVVGGTNEAIHQSYQLGMALDHGTSFGVLRQLIRLEIENGDYDLARKHAQVLARSPFNRKTAASAISMANSQEKAAGTGTDPRSEDGFRRADSMVSDNNSVYNMSAVIMLSSNATPAAKERLLCHLMLSGDREGFNALMDEYFADAPADRIPRAFRNFR